MSKITKAVTEKRKDDKFAKDMAEKKAVVNYMGGISYEVDPLLTLKMITASSIFGEPQYYRNGEFAEKGVLADAKYALDATFAAFAIILTEEDGVNDKTTTQIMEEAIDNALDFDFDSTLNWAVELRKEYNMRLNPQVIMVRAAIHPKRAEFMNENPGVFDAIQQIVMSRADEPGSQLAYYIYKNGGIAKLPNPLKKTWAKKIASLSRYEFAKYRNKGLGLTDVIRVSHAKGALVDELLRTGTIEVKEEDTTWESLKTQGKSWDEIVHLIRMPHMALLRNLRGIFISIKDQQTRTWLLESLVDGVEKGKQFPFAYKKALESVLSCDEVDDEGKDLVNKTLEDCVDVSADKMPHLVGRVAVLSDNSGSAHGTFTSEFGSVSVANIDNLSAVITAKNADEGYVGIFGDRLVMMPIKHDDKVLKKAIEADGIGTGIGASTENGIWLFLDKAIKDKEHWDHIFVYSDMQAGHGGLYGTNPKAYQEYVIHRHSIDVAKLVDVYRKTVNPKVNVHLIQTAGYTNVVLPEYGYRTNILYGWTGKELVFADKMNKLWDEYDAQAILHK